MPTARPMEEVARDIDRLAEAVERATAPAALLALLGELDQVEAEWLDIGRRLGLGPPEADCGFAGGCR